VNINKIFLRHGKEVVMKNLNQETQESKVQSTEQVSALDLNMSIYNEMNDQTQSSVNVLALINDQFKQIHEMNKRRTLLLKEVSQYLVK
jgi:hypothetical protein